MTYTNIRLFTANGIPEALSNLWYGTDCSVVEIQDAIEDAKNAADLLRRIQRMKLLRTKLLKTALQKPTLPRTAFLKSTLLKVTMKKPTTTLLTMKVPLVSICVLLTAITFTIPMATAAYCLSASIPTIGIKKIAR